MKGEAENILNRQRTRKQIGSNHILEGQKKFFHLNFFQEAAKWPFVLDTHFWRVR